MLDWKGPTQWVHKVEATLIHYRINYSNIGSTLIQYVPMGKANL